jgi:hypothetical protein
MRIYASQPIAATVAIDNGKTVAIKSLCAEFTYRTGEKHDPYFVTGSILLPDTKGIFDSERSALTITINADLSVSILKDNAQILGLSKVVAKLAGMICTKQHELARALLIVAADKYRPKNGPLTIEPVSVLFDAILSHGGDGRDVDRLTPIEVAEIFASISHYADIAELAGSPLVGFAIAASKALQETK